jgi:hypothetical protein
LFFEKIRGHEEILERFKTWLASDAFQGVYLFSGPKGVGKYSIAKELSRYIICNGVQDSTCRCSSCKLFPGSPDFLEIGNGTGNVIKAGDIESIDGFADLLPSLGRKKVLLIDDAERMNGTSANRLLKILEDVKSHLIVFLISSKPEWMIPTVLSRSNQIRFSALSPQRVLEILKEKGYKSKRLSDFRRAVPTLSHSILNNFDTYDRCVGWVQEFMANFSTSDEDDLLGTIESWDETDDLAYCSEIMLVFLSDILRIHMDDKNIVFNSDNIDMVERMSLSWKMKLCVAALEKLRPILLDYKRGVNIKLRPRISAWVGWIYAFMQKERNDR